MKTISILQPWASLIALGHKTIETRSFYTKHRGEVLIHASARIPTNRKLYEDLYLTTADLGFTKNWHTLPKGAIIGKVSIVDVISTDHVCRERAEESNEWNIHEGLPKHLYNYLKLTDQEFKFGNFESGRYAWILEEPILFEKPIPAKGKLNFWDFDISGFV